MKYIKYSFLLALVVGFSSCLKNSRDIGGLLSDKGSIVTSISESAYLNTDAQNIGAGYVYTNANFNFLTRPNEAVKFFTLKISQPLQTKLSGPLVLKVTTSAYDAQSGGSPYPFAPADVPAGAIKITDITVPASSDKLIIVPVLFTVNKTLLDPNQDYGIKFTLSSANQGVISEGDKSINVIFNYSDYSANINASDYEANYTYKSVIVDPSGEVGINNNKTMYLIHPNSTTLEYVDLYVYALTAPSQRADIKFLIANNFSTGARTALFRPNFTIDGSGKVTGITNASGTTSVTNLALDPTGSNKFVYTSNNNRTLSLKYTFTYTTTINGVITPRTVKVSEDFSYDPNQIYF